MFGNRRDAARLTHTALFLSLIIAGSWISVPFIPVPLTLQTLFVLLAGCVMKRDAFIPAGLYILLGALTLPVFHNGSAGIGVLLGPTGGYIIGFVFAALICGIAYEGESTTRRVAGLITATFVILLCGAFWLSVSTGIELGKALVIGVLPFIPGDLLKAAAAHVIATYILSPTRSRGGVQR